MWIVIKEAIVTVLMLALLAHAFTWDLFGIAPVYSVLCFIALILLAWFLVITAEN